MIKEVSNCPHLQFSKWSWWKCLSVISRRDQLINSDRKSKRTWVLVQDFYESIWSKSHNLYPHLSFHSIADLQLRKLLFMRWHLVLYSELLTSPSILIQQVVSKVKHVGYTTFSFLSFTPDEFCKIRVLSLVSLHAVF